MATENNNILSREELEHIKDHKYNTTGYSWLDNKMNPFWIFCAKLLPFVIKFVKIIYIVAKSKYGYCDWYARTTTRNSHYFNF
jgi:hypothetical protein